MLKHILLLVLLSLVAVYSKTMGWIHDALNGLASAHTWIAKILGENVFGKADPGAFISSALALFVFPILITSLIALIFQLFKRYRMPHFMIVFWMFWFIQLAVVLK